MISGLILHTFPPAAEYKGGTAFHYSPTLYALLHEAGTVWRGEHMRGQTGTPLVRWRRRRRVGRMELTLTSAHVATGLEQHGCFFVRADYALLYLGGGQIRQQNRVKAAVPRGVAVPGPEGERHGVWEPEGAGGGTGEREQGKEEKRQRCGGEGGGRREATGLHFADVLHVLELPQLGQRVVTQRLVERRVAVLVLHVQLGLGPHQQLCGNNASVHSQKTETPVKEL
ncbi:hypothetical protein EYF80_022260 [Liparis tanakae]|uniref:Uncharacterized protein n=1 Tax=Liparis tanakae TaxID=230148 RepID=A0A4Z2HR36_9TELE|nr:hypothetical protein EYF80_022260 [Liparis tanakae]